MKNKKYAIIWEDGYPTTFYKDFNRALDSLRQTEYEQGISGSIVTIDEYLNA
jgi:hypothetical protein